MRVFIASFMLGFAVFSGQSHAVTDCKKAVEKIQNMDESSRYQKVQCDSSLPENAGLYINEMNVDRGQDGHIFYRISSNRSFEPVIWDEYEYGQCSPSDANACKTMVGKDVVYYSEEGSLDIMESICKTVLGDLYTYDNSFGTMSIVQISEDVLTDDSQKSIYRGHEWSYYKENKKPHLPLQKADIDFNQELILESFACRSVVPMKKVWPGNHDEESSEVKILKTQKMKEIRKDLEKITPFKIPTELKSIFFIDVSGSIYETDCMGGKCSDYILRSMANIVFAMNENQSINLVFFDGANVYKMFDGPQRLTPDKKEMIIQTIDQISQRYYDLVASNLDHVTPYYHLYFSNMARMFQQTGVPKGIYDRVYIFSDFRYEDGIEMEETSTGYMEKEDGFTKIPAYSAKINFYDQSEREMLQIEDTMKQLRGVSVTIKSFNSQGCQKEIAEINPLIQNLGVAQEDGNFNDVMDSIDQKIEEYKQIR